ncbi:MAG: hypothetical protein DMG57_39265 [Acidobacteria bacterium]|nr:MAG: hypothetical protein DMG57_39265 [Acidobacteriota bacterium]
MAQMAMSVVLVMAAVIFMRNLLALQWADPGFDRRNLVLFGIRPGTSGYNESQLPPFYFNLERRLTATTGVAAVGMASRRPMNMGGGWGDLRLAGQSAVVNASLNGVTSEYLPLFVPRMVAGRNITRADINSEAKVAVISEDLARKLDAESVLGRPLEFPSDHPARRNGSRSWASPQ